MTQFITCPGCGWEFEVENYSSGKCPRCKEYEFYWDEVYDEEENETYFEGFSWQLPDYY